MKKLLLLALTTFLLQSCIPLRIAPNIENYKVKKGKRFKRTLSKRHMFIFEDQKEANEFYGFVNTKFQLDDAAVYDDVPFLIDGEQYFFAWYEVEIPDKSLNLIPIAFDTFLNVAVGNDEVESFVSSEENTFSRKGNWYVAIEVYSDIEKDCLTKTSLSKKAVLNYLHTLKEEYLATNNYNDTVFKN